MDCILDGFDAIGFFADQTALVDDEVEVAPLETFEGDHGQNLSCQSKAAAVSLKRDLIEHVTCRDRLVT